MLKYYEYLLRIKTLLHDTYSLDVLDNLEQFPIEADESLNEYYLKIAQIIDGYKKTPQNGFKYDRFYVQNIKPFFAIIKYIMRWRLFPRMIRQVKQIG